MQPAIHFYDAQFIGSPAHGQLVSFDSLSVVDGKTSSYSTQIRLRPDVSFSPQSVEQSDFFDLDLGLGVTEYEWSRRAHALFARPGTLHVGMGNTTTIDKFIRYALYRSLSTLPNTELPAGAYYLDLFTVGRAIGLLRPESSKFSWDESWPERRKRAFVHSVLPSESRAGAVMRLASELAASNPKLLDHAIAHSSADQIASLCGLVDGHVESLSSLRPVFVCHEQLCSAKHFGLFLAVGTDPQYKNIIYLVDLESDLTDLIEDGGNSVTRFIRTEPSQYDRPVLRVNLNRVPFVSPIGVIDPATAKRLKVDMATVKGNVAKLQGQSDLCLALMEVSGASEANLNADPDFQLFGAEYLAADKQLMQQLHETPADQWESLLLKANDARIKALGMRLLNRCMRDASTGQESAQWTAHCASRLLGRTDPLRFAATKDYCEKVAKSSLHPHGMRAAASHWLKTIESGNEPINV